MKNKYVSQDFIKNQLYDGLIMVSLMLVATFLALLARQFGFSEANIIMIFLLGVLIVAFKTHGFWAGIIASIVAVLLFNFFFIEPRFTFAFRDRGYGITFPIMLMVSLITSTLTSKIQFQADLSIAREQRTGSLYEISQSFLKTRGTTEIINLSLKHVSRFIKHKVIFYLLRDEQEIAETFSQAGPQNPENSILNKKERGVLEWVINNQKKAGRGTDMFSDSKALYLPIKGQEKLLGIIELAGRLETEQITFLENVVAQVALALDRERLSEEQEQSKVEIEKEIIRSNLIGSISHDLRTPLTGIAGASGTLLENIKTLPPDVVKKLLLDINQEAEWLIHLVENLLSLTRLDEGRINLSKSFEAIEEIVAEALRRINKRLDDHKISLDIPDQLILVPMDGSLIVQVIINLVDNAVKYTPPGCQIRIKVSEETDQVIFEIADNGPGIPVESLAHVFDRFYTTHTKTGDARRGVGLGLAICKSIVEAHGGVIEAANNPEGGAVFRFSLPYQGQGV